MRSAPTLVLATLALLALASSARGEGLPRLAVNRTDAAADCPDAPALAALVEAKMKHPALDPRAGGPASFDVRVDKTAKGYQAVLQADGRLRVIDDEGSTCAGLADSLAITLAILLDEDAPKPPSPAPPRHPIEPPPAPAPEAPPPPPPAPRYAFPPAPRLQLLGHALVSDGLQWPGAFGFDVRARLHVDERWSLEASLLDLPSVSRVVFVGTTSVELVAGGFGPCARLLGRHTGVAARLCAELDLGTLTGLGENYPIHNNKQVRPWGAAALEADVGGPIFGPFAWTVRGGGVVPFSREHFTVDNAPANKPAFSALPVGGVLGAGLGLTIW